ncbi:MAG: LuxR C-terminal-related transcriptional regulator [Actinomycetota bacterium]
MLIISDHPRSREGLVSGSRRVPDVEVAGVVSRVEEAIRGSEELRPDIVLLDSRPSPEVGLEAVERLHEATGAQIVLVAGRDDDLYILARAREAGASGVLPRLASPEVVAGALQVVRAGGFYMDRTRASLMVEQVQAHRERARKSGPLLTPRELEVLGLLAEGLSARRIGRRLELSERTVNTHVGNLYRKLGVSNRVEAVREGMRRGIVSSER